jgi:ATP-dependent Clp protease adaptor protein ClpS
MPETKNLPEPDVLGREELTPLYNVVLLDDNSHTYEYVIEMLVQLFCLSENGALAHAREVDITGRTVVITCELPQAEFAREQIQNYGPDWRIPESKGSMSAILEPAAGS